MGRRHCSASKREGSDLADHGVVAACRSRGRSGLCGEAGSFLIYSTPRAWKLKHIAANPNVALRFNTDATGEDIQVILGKVLILDVPADRNAAYVAKYALVLPGWAWMPPPTRRPFYRCPACHPDAPARAGTDTRTLMRAAAW